jgi:hypothetical protein
LLTDVDAPDTRREGHYEQPGQDAPLAEVREAAAVDPADGPGDGDGAGDRPDKPGTDQTVAVDDDVLRAGARWRVLGAEDRVTAEELGGDDGVAELLEELGVLVAIDARCDGALEGRRNEGVSAACFAIMAVRRPDGPARGDRGFMRSS